MPRATEPQHSIECQLCNKHGIHVRTAAIISEICERYPAQVTIKSERTESDGRDMMRLLMLEAGCGSTLKLSATGDQAEAVLDELVQAIKSGFKDTESE